MKYSRIARVLLLIVAAFYGSVASATLVVYTDRATWEGVVGGFVTEDFNGVTPGSLSLGVNNVGLISIELFDQVAENRIDSGSGFNNINGTNFWNGNMDAFGNPSSAMILQDSIIAFGADWTDTTTGGLLTATIGGETLLFSDYLSGAGGGFLGVVADSPFSSIAFDTEHGGAEQFGMDDFSFSAVPEPATLMLLGLGLAGIGYSRKKTA